MAYRTVLLCLLLMACGSSLAHAAQILPAQYDDEGMMGRHGPHGMMNGQGPMGMMGMPRGRSALGPRPTGRQVFNNTCVACHRTGVMGAPRVGDEDAWAPRIAKGRRVLYRHALRGFRAMPPKGGNTALTDREVMAAVDYMVNQARR